MSGRTILTTDARFQKLLHEADRIAPTPVPVLIEGESGTGKELLARRIHAGSERGRGETRRFVAVNCAALSRSLVESELFGHAAGAFTGAIRDRKGLVEEAAGGTLFLDEIGELPVSAQAKLLRVLQEGEVRRVGESKPVPVRFRVVAATNRSLKREVERGRFRADLFYRIHVVRFVISPLRERTGDTLLLAETFRERLTAEYGKETAGFSDRARRVLERYRWPGNVRELENEIKRAVALVEPGDRIRPSHFSESVRHGPGTSAHYAPHTLREKLGRVERIEIMRIMEETGGNKTRAARALGLSRQGLKNKLIRYGWELDRVEWEREKNSPA